MEGGIKHSFLRESANDGVSRRERRMAWSIMSSTAFEVKENEDVNLPRVSREEETVTLTVWKAERPYLEREAMTRSRTDDREGRL